MASPQKENGYTPIANEILEELVKIDLLGAEFRVLFFMVITKNRTEFLLLNLKKVQEFHVQP